MLTSCDNQPRKDEEEVINAADIIADNEWALQWSDYVTNQKVEKEPFIPTHIIMLDINENIPVMLCDYGPNGSGPAYTENEFSLKTSAEYVKDEYGNWLWCGKEIAGDIWTINKTTKPTYTSLEGYKEWRKDGDFHRTDGPAREWANGEKEWWLDGENVSENEFNQLTKD